MVAHRRTFLCLLLLGTQSTSSSADHTENTRIDGTQSRRKRIRQRPATQSDKDIERHDTSEGRQRRLSPLSSPPQVLPTTFEHFPTYDSAFDHIRLDLSWPAPESHREDISATFGPRLLPVLQCSSLQADPDMPCFDFHPGIDVEGNEGDRVVSVYNGTVSRITTFTCGGLVVEIQHEFSHPVIFHDDIDQDGNHPDPVSTWYSRYEHLDEARVSEGQIIESGEMIGRVGRSGNCDETTGQRAVLHFAVLLSNSNPPQRDIEYDPRIHPFMALPFNNILHNWSPLLIQRSDVGEQSEGSIEIQTRNVRPDVYRVVTRILRESDGQEVSSHVIDFNKREGCNLSLPKEYYHNMMYTPDLSEPHLLPAYFDSNEGVWSATLYIPSSWVAASLPGVGTDEAFSFEVHVTDSRRRRYDYNGPVILVN